MEVVFRVDATVTELRRVLGLPDVLALYELRSRAFEHWLVILAGTAGEVEPMPSRPGQPSRR